MSGRPTDDALIAQLARAFAASSIRSQEALKELETRYMQCDAARATAVADAFELERKIASLEADLAAAQNSGAELLAANRRLAVALQTADEASAKLKRKARK